MGLTPDFGPGAVKASSAGGGAASAGLPAHAVRIGARRQFRAPEIEQMSYKARDFRHYDAVTDAGQNVSDMTIGAHGWPRIGADLGLSYENP